MRTMVGALLCVSMVFAASTGRAQEVAGGWSEVPSDDKDIAAVAQFAVAAQVKALEAEGKKGCVMALVKVLSAKQQVVAGMNYRLALKVAADGAEKEAEVVVWKQLSGEYKLTSWAWLKEGEAGKPCAAPQK